MNHMVLFITGALGQQGPSCDDNKGTNCLDVIGSGAIPQNRFACCSFKIYTIQEGVTSIGHNAFAGTGLTSLLIPSSVTSIGSNAFIGCENLTNISWTPSSQATIGINAFRSTGLTSFDIPNRITRIENGTFYYTERLTSVTIPTSVTFIGYGAFRRSGLTSVIIPPSVTSIKSRAFMDNSNLRSWSIPSGLSLNDEQFSGCGCDDDPDKESVYGDDYDGNYNRGYDQAQYIYCPVSGPENVCQCTQCNATLAPTLAPRPSDDNSNETLKLGLGIGLGFGLPCLAVSLYVVFKQYRPREEKENSVRESFL